MNIDDLVNNCYNCHKCMMLDSWSLTTRKRHKISWRLFHSREYFRPPARIKHPEILKEVNIWFRVSNKTFTFTKTAWSRPTCPELSPQVNRGVYLNIHPCKLSRAHRFDWKTKKVAEILAPPSSPRLLHPGFNLPLP